MTWSVSFIAPSKDAAQVELPIKLSQSMLQQRPHARDFKLVLDMLSAAIDVCEGGAIAVSASGHVNYVGWDAPVPGISGLYLSSVSVSAL